MADWRTTVNKWLFDIAITRAFAKWYFDLIKNAVGWREAGLVSGT
jgi:hypothetical protein